jgi:hypothetical protein
VLDAAFAGVSTLASEAVVASALCVSPTPVVVVVAVVDAAAAAAPLASVPALSELVGVLVADVAVRELEFEPFPARADPPPAEAFPAAPAPAWARAGLAGGA